MRRKLNQGLLLMAAILTLPAAAPQDKLDHIRIVSVEPAGPLTRGVETEISVEIEYTLETADESAVNFGFNSQEPARFAMREHIAIHRGTERLKVKFTIIPVDWARRGKFAMLVNLGKGDGGKSWSPTVATRYEFTVVP